jgi:predicted LPLAT superfamily acyltransferase/uncharacterized membrane protein
MRFVAWLGVVALVMCAHRYDRGGALDALPAFVAGLVGIVFARTLRRGHTPLIARAIAAIDGAAWLDDPAVARYARRLTCLWALYQFALAGAATMLALHAHGWLTLPLRTTPGEFGLLWLPGAIAFLFVGEFALRPLFLPQVPRPNLFVFVAKLIRCWPALLREQAPGPVSPHWSERREGGGRFAVWLIRTIGMRLGRRASRALLYPITLYFFFRRGPERRASRAFLSRAFSKPAGMWSVLRHIHCFAATILDRVFLLARSTRGFDIRIHGLDQLETQIAPARGVLLLGAHIGSFEALRALAELRPELRVRMIMDRGQTPALTELLHALNPAVAGMVIDVGGSAVADIALAIRDAAHDGALIGLLGDRARPGEATREAQFYGAPAAFPIAPYLIASALELPVVLSFGLYRGGNRYDVYFETFAERIVLARAERAVRLAEWTQRYAARLQHYTQLDPYNWFNFYDFWHRPAAADPARRSSVANAA